MIGIWNDRYESRGWKKNTDGRFLANEMSDPKGVPPMSPQLPKSSWLSLGTSDAQFPGCIEWREIRIRVVLHSSCNCTLNLRLSDGLHHEIQWQVFSICQQWIILELCLNRKISYVHILLLDFQWSLIWDSMRSIPMISHLKKREIHQRRLRLMGGSTCEPYKSSILWAITCICSGLSAYTMLNFHIKSNYLRNILVESASRS